MASSRAMSLPNREEANVAVASYYVGGDPTQLVSRGRERTGGEVEGQGSYFLLSHFLQGFSKRGRLRRVVEEGRRRFLMSDGKMFSALFLGSQGNPDRGRRNRKEADGKKYRRRRRKEGGSSSTPDRSGLSDLLLSLGEEADEELEEPSFSSSCVSLEAGAEAGRLFQVGGHLLRPRGGPHKGQREMKQPRFFFLLSAHLFKKFLMKKIFSSSAAQEVRVQLGGAHEEGEGEEEEGGAEEEGGGDDDASQGVEERERRRRERSLRRDEQVRGEVPGQGGRRGQGRGGHGGGRGGVAQALPQGQHPRALQDGQGRSGRGGRGRGA